MYLGSSTWAAEFLFFYVLFAVIVFNWSIHFITEPNPLLEIGRQTSARLSWLKHQTCVAAARLGLLRVKIAQPRLPSKVPSLTRLDLKFQLDRIIRPLTSCSSSRLSLDHQSDSEVRDSGHLKVKKIMERAAERYLIVKWAVNLHLSEVPVSFK